MADLRVFDELRPMVEGVPGLQMTDAGRRVHDLLGDPLRALGLLEAGMPLTPGAQLVARLYVCGLSGAEIARATGLSLNTVKTYMTYVTDTCGVTMHELRRQAWGEIARVVGHAWPTLA